jgi:hypothetical protein
MISRECKNSMTSSICTVTVIETEMFMFIDGNSNGNGNVYTNDEVERREERGGREEEGEQ